MMKFPLCLSKVRHLSKTWLGLLLAAGLAACAGATKPAEPPPLPVETEEIRPEPTDPTAALATAALATATTMSPPATETATEIPPSPTPLPDLVLPDLGLAPDFTNEVWLNTEAPLNLETLRGKVVLVEFWTFG